MLVKCSAACTHLSSTVYELQYSEILVGNSNFFLPPCTANKLNAEKTDGGVPIGMPGKILILIKLESWATRQ